MGHVFSLNKYQAPLLEIITEDNSRMGIRWSSMHSMKRLVTIIYISLVISAKKQFARNLITEPFKYDSTAFLENCNS